MSDARIINCYYFIPDGTDELLISAKAKKYWGTRIAGINSIPGFAKLYDKATAAAETDTPIDVVMCPANATATLGAGNNALLPVPMNLTNGLSVRFVTGIADNDDTGATASKFVVSVYWE